MKKNKAGFYFVLMMIVLIVGAMYIYFIMGDVLRDIILRLGG